MPKVFRPKINPSAKAAALPSAPAAVPDVSVDTPLIEPEIQNVQEPNAEIVPLTTDQSASIKPPPQPLEAKTDPQP